MDVREKLVEIMENLGCNDEYCKDCEFCNDIDGICVDYYDGDAFGGFDVTHWMPIPQPPKGE